MALFSCHLPQQMRSSAPHTVWFCLGGTWHNPLVPSCWGFIPALGSLNTALCCAPPESSKGPSGRQGLWRTVNRPLLFLCLPFVRRYEEVSFLSISSVSVVCSFGEGRMGGCAPSPTPREAWSNLPEHVQSVDY